MESPWVRPFLSPPRALLSATLFFVLACSSAEEPAIAPISGGTLMVTADGAFAVAADPDRDAVHIVALSTSPQRALARIALEAKDEPGRVVEGEPGTAFVALRRGGAIAVIDIMGMRLRARVPVCSAPRGLAFDASRAELHVACANGELVTIDAVALAPVRSLMLARDLRDVAIEGERLLVSRFRRSELIALDRAGNRLPTSQPTSGVGPPQRSRTSDATSVRRFAPAVAWRLATSKGGSTVLLHQYALGGEATGGAPPPEVSTEAGGYSGNGRSPDGINRSCLDSIVGSAVSFASSAGGLFTSMVLAGVTLAVDAALSPDGRTLAVAAPGNAPRPLPPTPSFPTSGDTFDFIGGREGSGSPPSRGLPAELGGGSANPQLVIYQLVVPPSGSDNADAPTPCLPPMAPGGFPITSDEVVAVAFSPAGTLVSQTRAPSLIIGGINGRAAVVPLDGAPMNNEGHALFHRNVGGGIACASCHPEGGDDGRTWHFAGVGPRRTQSLWGGIMQSAPFHWDGDLPDLTALVDEVMVKRMGGVRPSNEQIGRLGHWLDTVAPPVAPPGDAAAVARGKELFHSSKAACSDCHSGALATNNKAANVGTGGRFQVPRLAAVRWRAPYLHDGCAPSLKDRFGACGGGDAHGNVSNLNVANVDDVIAYLESL